MDLFFIIFPGVWGLVGVIFTAIGVGITSNRKRKEQRCTMYTSGTVIDVVRRVSSDMDGHSAAYWHPVFSYYAGGRQIQRESHFGSGQPKFTVGETVQICYNPDNAEDYYVVEEMLAPLLGRIFTWVGIACLTVAVITLIAGRILVR